jgi:hypothetical protein
MLYMIFFKTLLTYVADLTLLILMGLENQFTDPLACLNSNNATATQTVNVAGVTTDLPNVSASYCPVDKSSFSLFIAQARPWVYLASLILSIIFIFLDYFKAKGIIASDDIGLSFTNQAVYRFYSFNSFPHFCLFNRIQASKSFSHKLSFFCFFQFKGKDLRLVFPVFL